MAKSRTLNIQASYFKKVGLKHCIMKARNALKKNRAGSGFGRKPRRDSGIKRKKTSDKAGFENPIVDPQQLLSNLNFIMYN